MYVVSYMGKPVRVTRSSRRARHYVHLQAAGVTASPPVMEWTHTGKLMSRQDGRRIFTGWEILDIPTTRD
ncbi:hypothetical protein [Streptomyces sp. NPDC001774]